MAEASARLTAPREIEEEIAQRRQDLTMLVAELRHRRRRLTDVGQHLQEHGAALAMALAVAAGIAAAVYSTSRGRRARPARRAGRQLLRSAGSALAALVIRQAGKRLARRYALRLARRLPWGSAFPASPGTRRGLASWR